MSQNMSTSIKSQSGFKKIRKRFDSRQLELQSMVWPGLIFFFIFMYLPLYGLQIAFQDYNPIKGFADSPWIGFEYFENFLTDRNFLEVMRNTISLNAIHLIIGFPAPIIFALMLNEIRNTYYKKITQTISYLPHFVSWAIYGGLVISLLNTTGIVNDFLVTLGILDEPVLFMGKDYLFWIIAASAGTIKGLGWGSIIYIAAISGVDQELYDASTVDGAGRFKKMWYVTIPSILPTIVIMFIFTISRLLNTGFDQIYILQNELNIAMSETIDTYVYKVGISDMNFSYATAVGLMRSVIAVMLLLSANYLSNKTTEQGLF